MRTTLLTTRALPILLVTLVVALMVALAVYLYDTSRPAARGDLIGYTVLSDDAVQIDFEVRPDGTTGVVCALRARDAEGFEVGNEDVPVPDTGEDVVRVTHELATTNRAVAPEVVGCGVPLTGP